MTGEFDGQLAGLLVCLILVFASFAPSGALPSKIIHAQSGNATSQSGIQTGWIVVTLPNPEVTPDWRAVAPPECAGSEDQLRQCANNHQFWDLWDFTNFADAIDAVFERIAAQGQYTGVIPLITLGDTPAYWNNIHLMHAAAVSHGLAFAPVIFPKWKWGAEWCYLYPTAAPASCDVDSQTGAAVAYEKMMDLMDFVQNLDGGCPPEAFNDPFAIWYGWDPAFRPGFGVIQDFWHALPASPCNHQAAYALWADDPFVADADSRIPEVGQLQTHIVSDHQQPFWVRTELYGGHVTLFNSQRYSPYQVVVTGIWAASDAGAWASALCDKWTSIAQPSLLAVWTYFDRDTGADERYGALAGGNLADITAICQ